MAAVKPQTRLVSKQDAALALGVSRPTLDRYVREGLPVIAAPATNRRQGFKIDLDVAQRWLGGHRQRQVMNRPPLDVRIYEAAKKLWWSRLRGLMSPENLALSRNQCRDTNDLIRTARLLSRRVAVELEAMVERMEADG